jgi:putative ATP-dependent DNA ligase
MSEAQREDWRSPDALAEAIEAGRAQEGSFAGLGYVRFADDGHGARRGTVVAGGRVLHPYPSIGRIFALGAGLRKAFRGRFHAEEKMDGYNVRIARFAGRVLAFTRGGFVCPFTVDRLPDLGEFAPLLEAEPDLVVCGEVVGPGNPYLASETPRVREDVRFFAFDLMRFDREAPLDLAERDALLERFRVPRAPSLGWFTIADQDRIREEVLRLDAEGAEGVIFKPQGEGLRLKYVTPRVNVEDIAVDGALLAELPAEFFLGRVLRLAIGLEELGLASRIRDAEERVGRALVSGFLPVVREVAAGGKVAQVHEVRLHTEAAADLLVRHLNRASPKVQVRELARRRDGAWVVLRFEKTFLQSTSRLKNLLDGDYVID